MSPSVSYQTKPRVMTSPYRTGAAVPALRRTILLEDLHARYGSSGGGSFRMRLQYARKRYLWKLVVAGATFAKRLIDVLVCLIMLVLLFPLFLAVAAFIKLTDHGPVFFWQNRVGQWGAEFSFPKFRSMVMNAEALKDKLLASNDHVGGITFKMKKDPRVTWIGRILRKASIDELPQLWCVLKGEMSLVGPRPPVPREVALYSLRDRRRLDVKPGLTCIWQVSGRGDIPFDQQVELDVQYIESQSLWLDILLLLKTAPAILFGTGAY
jgi:lipopolysaccharide/colanic/teichoic acid biosynthesis glycosyltransferase